MNKEEMLEILKNIQTHENDNSFSVSYRYADKTITISYDTSEDIDTDKLVSVVTPANND